MKLGKGIHEIFVFYTPKLMDIYFQYLKNKFKKAVGITTLLVQGNDLPNIHSESHMGDSTLLKIYPTIRISKGQAEDISLEVDSLELPQKVIDLDKQSKIKSFSKSQKSKQTQKSCIINKKAS